jgi:hypothetical protein
MSEFRLARREDYRGLARQFQVLIAEPDIVEGTPIAAVCRRRFSPRGSDTYFQPELRRLLLPPQARHGIVEGHCGRPRAPARAPPGVQRKLIAKSK